jgi:hypothetical protein
MSSANDPPDSGTMKAALERAIQRTLRVFGLRLARDRAFLDLIESAQAAMEAVGGLRQEIEQLRESLRQVEATREMHRARAQWTKVMFEEMLARQRREFGDLIQSIVEQRGFDNGRRRIVVMVTATSQVTQLKALAGSERLKSDYELTVIAYADVKESGILDLCAREGIRLLSYDLHLLCGDHLNITAEPDNLHPSTDIEAALRRRELTEDTPRMQDIALFFSEVRHQSNFATTAQRALSATAADLLVLFENNAEYPTGIWIDVANRMSIPSVILPYTIADQLEPAEAHILNEDYWSNRGIYNRLAEIAFPQWLYHHRDRWLLRRPGVRLMAAEALGVAPPTPWILNSSRATAVAVESKAMHDHYIAQEIPEAQLVTTGSVTDDLMHRALEQKDELRHRLGLDPGKPVLLCSLPPNQFPRPQCQFSDFRAVVDFWLNELKRVEGWEIVVKLHPSMRPEDIDYVRTFDVRISDLETTSLIPLCDLYNPSVSSTIRWALACGKPVLNYDVFGYRYREFASEPAVLTVFDSDAFSSELRRLTQDNESLRELTDKAAGAASRWGMNDGRSMERILALFHDLTERRGVPTSPS